MACGLLYGMGHGVLTCMIATFIGTIMCFFTSRLLLKNCLRRKIERGKRTRALFYAIDKHAVKFVVLIRFTPLPLGMATAICAITRVRFWVFFPVSFTVQMIHISVYTFLGTGITSITDLVSGKHTPPAQIGILVGSVAMLAIMFILGIIIGRRALKSAAKEMKAEQATKEAATASAIRTSTEEQNPTDLKSSKKADNCGEPSQPPTPAQPSADGTHDSEEATSFDFTSSCDSSELTASDASV